MHRTFLYFAGFTGMGSLFLGMVVLAALVLGSTNPATGAASPEPSAMVPDSGPVGTITITAFTR